MLVHERFRLPDEGNGRNTIGACASGDLSSNFEKNRVFERGLVKFTGKPPHINPQDTPMKTVQKNLIASAAALLLTAAAGRAQTAYALADGGTSLIKFDLSTPTITTLVGTFSGDAERIDGIDFRPSNGLLYGYSRGDTLVTISLDSAATAFVSTPTTVSSVNGLGIDFNPVADRLRLVNTADQNLRINVANGNTIVDGPLTYAAGDSGFGINPQINEAAYSNSDRNPLTETRLFYVDIGRDVLVSTLNPNGGELTTVGPLGINAGELTGFDILSDGFGGNSAFAILTSGGNSSLYRVNLNTGAATSVGIVSQTAGVRPFSLAIVQPIPEPGTALFGFALAGACLSRSRRRLASGA